MEIIGHRGNGRGPQENTLASCQAAVKAGATRLELDVQLVDGELILAHPPAKQSDRLQNILDNLTVPLVLHLKRRHFNARHDRHVLAKLATLIPGRDIVISSFWPGTLTFAAKHFPEIKTAYATFWAGYDLHFANRLKAAEFHAWYRTLTPAAVKLAHRKNLKIVAFVPPGTPDAEQRIAALQPDGVLVDDVSSYATRFEVS